MCSPLRGGHDGVHHLDDPVQGRVGADGHIRAAEVVVNGADHADDVELRVTAGCLRVDQTCKTGEGGGEVLAGMFVHVVREVKRGGERPPCCSSSSNRPLHSSLNRLAPVRLPSPPITHRLVMPRCTRLCAAFRRPSWVRNSLQRALPMTVPPWGQHKAHSLLKLLVYWLFHAVVLKCNHTFLKSFIFSDYSIFVVLF